MAGGSNGNPSSSEGRESAIETLIDMDPRGPYIRAAAILVSIHHDVTCKTSILIHPGINLTCIDLT